MPSAGAPPMRRSVLTACLLALTLTGCAARQGQLLPPDTDHDELMAAIAARGQDTSADGIPPTPESSRAADFVIETSKVATATAYVFAELLYGLGQAGWHR